MNLSHNSNKILISGQSGTGKSTYFTRYVLNSFQVEYNLIFVYDHSSEFGIRTGLPVCRQPEDMVNALPTGYVIFDPSELYEGDTETGFEFFCHWAFDRCKANLGFNKLFAVDEMQLFSSTSQVSFDLSCIIETGRKYELDFISVTQQLNLLHNRIRNQSTEIVAFRSVDKLILDALEERGFNPESVARLGTGDFIARDMRTATEKTGNIFTIDNGRQKMDIESGEEESSLCDGDSTEPLETMQ